MDLVTDNDFIIGTLCNLINFLEILEIDTLVGFKYEDDKSDFENATEFKNQVWNLMLNEYGFESADGNFDVLIDMENLYMPLDN